MANEITVQANLTYENGFLKTSINYGALSVTQTTLGKHESVVSVGTSEEDILVGDIGTLGWCFMRNLDSTNYVEWGKKDGSGNMQAIGRLKAGEVALFRLNSGVTLRMQANTAACKVQILILEN